VTASNERRRLRRDLFLLLDGVEVRAARKPSRGRSKDHIGYGHKNDAEQEAHNPG
jgi:hypothetical protein